MSKKKSRFRDSLGFLNALGFTVAITVICLITVGVTCLGIAGINVAWKEGIETTVTGSIQLHQLKYDRFWNMEYTDVEMRTYSGDTHHVRVKEHIDLEYGATYRVTYVKRNYWAHLYLVNEVVSMEMLPAINGSLIE